MRTFAVAILALLAGAAAADAQVRFRAETTVVYLDVVVRDAAGRPVTDLEVGDFEVLEDGVVQPLVWFDRSNAGNAAAGRSADAARRASPAFASNADMSQGPPQSIFAICLLYTSPSPRDRTRSRMPSSA